jgi:exopolysaccharide biosynthesis protein
MKIRLTVVFAIILALPVELFADWERIRTGVFYQEFDEGPMHAYVVRIDLREESIRLIASNTDDRGLRLRDFAEKHEAIVAINADFFSKELVPIGLAIGPCGTWTNTADTRREGVVALGDEKVEIYEPSHVMSEPPPWVESAVSGWPMLVRECKALTAKQLPGSDAFTRSPHPRTAIGVNRSGRLLYFVVTDGRREGVPGLTLAQLAKFMQEELDVCRAINLDGGGSSELVVEGEIRNRPSDGSERKLANHIAVIAAEQEIPCPNDAVKTSGK